MAAPPNDTPAGAITLPVNFGVIGGTNVEATNDFGGPSSVWYYVPELPPAPVGGLLVASTRAMANGPAEFVTDFDTNIRIFRGGLGPTPGAFLASSIYSDSVLFFGTPWAGTHADYAGWSRESEVVFERVGQTVSFNGVFIAVSGRNGAQGKFHLSILNPWRRYLTPRCARRRARWVAAGQAALPNITGPSTTRFQLADGTQEHPSGRYRAQYCSGAFRHISSLPDWVVTRIAFGANAVLFDAEYFIRINYRNGSETAHGYVPQGTSHLAASGQYTQLEIEALMRCAFVDFDHSGGPIELQFLDDSYLDNIAGTSLPAFSLWRQDDDFRFEIVGHSGTGQTITVEVRNVTAVQSNNVECRAFDFNGATVLFPFEQRGNVEAGGSFFYTFSFPLGGFVKNVEVVWYCLQIRAAGGIDQYLNGSARVGPVV